MNQLFFGTLSNSEVILQLPHPQFPQCPEKDFTASNEEQDVTAGPSYDAPLGSDLHTTPGFGLFMLTAQDCLNDSSVGEL